MGALFLIAALLAALHACGVTVCLFHRLTGKPCLTCGSTRALTALVSGDLSGALRIQPLAAIGGLLLTAAGCLYTTALLLERRVLFVVLTKKERRACWLAVSVLLLINWLYLLRRGV